MDELAEQLTRHIRLWHDIELPNAPALRMAEQLEETIAGFARLRAAPALEAMPGDFAHTLAELRDRDEPAPA